jgi:mannose-6-phosphate isomerase-like protein (cupin superfamily)
MKMNNNQSVIDIKSKFEKISEYWTPKIIAQMNDYHFKLAKFKGDFTWHSHEETDEVFYVVKGAMTIEMEDGNVELKEGELFVVPRGVEHKPFAREECHVLLVEPVGTINTGDSGGDLTAPAGEWLT